MQIYHPYWLWEDHKHGFYENISGVDKQRKHYMVVAFFNNALATKEYMFRVVNEWKYSCEHNLTNSNMNKIAYIGQAACCLYDGIPNTITMKAWSDLDKDVQERSNKIALEALNYWESKNIELCQNTD